MDTDAFKNWLDHHRAAKLTSRLMRKTSAVGRTMHHTPPKATLPDATIVKKASRGPLVRALERILTEWRDLSERDVMGQIKAATANFAQRYPSEVTWLSRVDSAKNALNAIVVHESVQRLRDPCALDGPGIVPRVARTGVPYATGDIKCDPYYTEIFENVASEQAVSIVVKGDESAMPSRYVLNQESRQDGQYYPASAELLREDAEIELTPLLRELEALRSVHRYCWNHRRHGWGLREFLATLLQQVKERVAVDGANNIHLAVWYVDQEDRVLAPVANTGFTHGVRFRQSLAFSEAGLIGQLASAVDWKVVSSHRTDAAMTSLLGSALDDTGVQGYRLIVTPELPALEGGSPFRIIIEMIALASESEELLPDADDLRRFADRIFDQVRGYLSLYPQLAADEVRCAIYECQSLPEQWRAVAKTIEKVLRAGAVTLYARPWKDAGNLHVIAATAPLKRADGTTLVPDPDGRPFLSLLPSGHTAWDRRSYAGTLAGRPGSLLRRNSYRHSGERLLREGFPLQPSSDYSESLATAESADPRFLGHSLPNSNDERGANKGRPAVCKSTAVVLAVRPDDSAPFKGWDSTALVSMLKAAAPTIRSWRDWAAVRLNDSQRVIEESLDEVRVVLGTYALSVDRGQETGLRGIGNRNWMRNLESGISLAVLADRLARFELAPHRRQDPIPRIGSRAAVSREVVAQAYELAWRSLIGTRRRSEHGDMWSMMAQAAILMESRGNKRTVMHPVAFYHERLNVVPKKGTPEDPRRLRVPDLGEDWCSFLDCGKPREFRTAAATIIRIPFIAWIGQHAARGALAVNLPAEEIPSGSNDLRMDLMLLARRLAAAWTVSGSSLPHGRFVSKTSRDEFEKNLRTHLGARSIRLILGEQQQRTPDDANMAWETPMITSERWEARVDPDAQLFGIQEVTAGNDIALKVPLYFGTAHVGNIVSEWSGDESVIVDSDAQMRRAMWVRDILAAWYLWSWSWTTRGHGNFEEALVYADVYEEECVWITKEHFRENASLSEDKVFSQDRARRTFELVHPKVSL
jgi:hypothetical protein